MNRFFHIAGYAYVTFAILAAHTALAPHETSFAGSVDDQAVVVTSEEVVRDHQRLYQHDADQVRAQVRSDKSGYTVEIWTADWCRKCPAYKRRAVPTLLKLGYTITNKDWDADAKERPENMRSVPSVRLYYKGTFLRMWVAPPARAIDLYVEQRMSLKGSP